MSVRVAIPVLGIGNDTGELFRIELLQSRNVERVIRSKPPLYPREVPSAEVIEAYK